jgi:hypothetical protein
MNTYDHSEDIMFDCGRLEKLMQLWRQPGDAASPLFLALNLMDFTARLRRHCVYVRQTGGYLPDECEGVFERARQLVINDTRIGNLVFEHLSFETFHLNLKQFIEQYDLGRMYDDAIFDTAADLTDHYFSTELVLDCAEQFLRIPDDRAADVKAFRLAFAQAVNRNPDLADAVRDRAETAPGGPGMPPWPQLLEHAPDHLFDTVLAAGFLDRMQHAAKEHVVSKILQFHPKISSKHPDPIEIPVAADNRPRLEAIKIYDLPDDGTFQAFLVQYDDILVVELFGTDLDQLPVPLVFVDNTDVPVQPYSESDLSRITCKIGAVDDYFGKNLLITFPGTDTIPIVIQVTPDNVC